MNLIIVSGAQTGADQAALDVSIELGIPYFGYIPKGRKNECGKIADKYKGLVEVDSPRYEARTGKNVEIADFILILSKYRPPFTGGTKLTHELACKNHKHFCIGYVFGKETNEVEVAELIQDFGEYKDFHLMIAGPRESKCPGIYDKSKEFIKKVLKKLEDFHVVHSHLMD